MYKTQHPYPQLNLAYWTHILNQHVVSIKMCTYTQTEQLTRSQRYKAVIFFTGNLTASKIICVAPNVQLFITIQMVSWKCGTC